MTAAMQNPGSQVSSSKPSPTDVRRMTVPDFQAFKKRGVRLTMLTA